MYQLYCKELSAYAFTEDSAGHCIFLLIVYRVLLDQLLQYEPVSGEEEEVTDYSGSEDEVPSSSRLHRPAGSVAKTVSPSAQG
jgi:hypothetical protein